MIKHVFITFLSFLWIFSCSPEDASTDTTTNDVEIVSEIEEEETETPEEETTTENTETTTEEETPEEETPIEETPGTSAKVPSDIIDFSKWNISIPIFESNGTSIDISTTELVNGYKHDTYFYVENDAVVFKNFVDGAKTSINTSYTRSELREMNYGTRFDTENGLSTKDLANNWVFSNSNDNVQSQAAAVGGELTATLTVDHVTTTGSSGHVGRTIIGQIHASGDEPCRLYYRKLPNNTKGSIYFAHEPLNESDDWHEMIGSRSNSASNPSDGIELGEKFSYSIKVVGTDLTVTIIREGKPDVAKTIDMSGSGFANDWMYFKAGLYTQNNTGEPDDYDKASFYDIKIIH